jgi:hypothetical protein
MPTDSGLILLPLARDTTFSKFRKFGKQAKDQQGSHAQQRLRRDHVSTAHPSHLDFGYGTERRTSAIGK